MIARERARQTSVEGWTPAHDDKHRGNELTLAAISYAEVVASPDEQAETLDQSAPTGDWPWADKWRKPSADPVRNLVKAGALIAAEIDRLLRKQSDRRANGKGEPTPPLAHDQNP